MLSFERRLAATLTPGEVGIAPYITAGDGGLELTLELLMALEDAGAACVELGLPFSDPVADGPVLQAAAQRALAAGVRLPDVLDVVARYRAKGGALPIALFSYANPLLRRGLQANLGAAAAAGIDALLVPDWPHDEDARLGRFASGAGLACVSFVAPTSSDARISAAAAASRGFLYAIGRLGVTGAATSLDDSTMNFLARVRAQTELPIGVGFGLRTREDVARLAGHAQLAIVGTALVKRVHEARASGNSIAETAKLAKDFLQNIKQGAPV